MALQLIESLIKIFENKVQAEDEVRMLFGNVHPHWVNLMAMGVKNYELRVRRCEGCRTREYYTASECTCAAPKLAGFYLVSPNGADLGPCPLNTGGGADVQLMCSNDAIAGDDGECVAEMHSYWAFYEGAGGAADAQTAERMHKR